ncbi:hypothetical protein [Brenneria goodwinii]|uniref:hypothetical protein n=1 Tax=Brenneria goodwinii TaxID=1109412 RepID=UPI0036F35A93
MYPLVRGQSNSLSLALAAAMSLQLFSNHSLAAGMTITFIYVGAFGALLYFPTRLSYR